MESWRCVVRKSVVRDCSLGGVDVVVYCRDRRRTDMDPNNVQLNKSRYISKINFEIRLAVVNRIRVKKNTSIAIAAIPNRILPCEWATIQLGKTTECGKIDLVALRVGKIRNRVPRLRQLSTWIQLASRWKVVYGSVNKTIRARPPVNMSAPAPP